MPFFMLKIVGGVSSNFEAVTFCTAADDFLLSCFVLLGQFHQGDFFAVRSTASESICRCKGTSEGSESASLVSCSEGTLTN